MYPIILATALACSEALWLAEGVRTNRDLTIEQKEELVEVFLKGCVEDSDANAD